MSRIEKIGAFYIGRKYDADKRETLPEEISFDARDLTTHAVCLGMTGSGKTGLCIDLLEEAALDMVPAIIIDPKGDITNLLLTFPDLLPEDFKPWVNIDDARRKDMTVDEYARKVSETWRNGLAEWDQTPERIKALKDSAEFTIYTPGSDAGTGMSILSALVPPKLSWDTEAELIREQIQGVVGAILGLMNIEADPLQSREYILLSGIVEHYWRENTALDLPILITSVQNPPMKKLGVFDTDTFFPAKERFKFAIALNSIVASPGFQSWLTGEPLDPAALLYTPQGKPRHSIIYLAHLSESQRMFFVTLLLERVVTWMRGQSGTTSLRALLYFDEVYGYLPPVAEPPSKKPLLTLLKQARAFGLGLVLTTQNPVDLDYKALSNAGTWFIGRLQTDRDKQRLMDGLESVSAESGMEFNKKEMDTLISSLGSRIFLLHNVHEDGPVLFQTRWAMSYLRGPLTRDQIRFLRNRTQVEQPDVQPVHAQASPPQETPVPEGVSSEPPPLPPGIRHVFIPPRITAGQALSEAGAANDATVRLVYEPALIAMGKVSFISSKQNISESQERAMLIYPDEGGVGSVWEYAEQIGLKVEDLSERPEPNSFFSGALPAAWSTVTKLKSAGKDFSDYLYYNSRIDLPFNPSLKIYGIPGESAEEFKARCADAAKQNRDEEVEKLRDRMETKLTRLRTKLSKEELELEEDKDDYKSRKNEEMLSAGETIAGFFGVLGRRRSSGLSTAARKRRMTQNAKADIKESEEEIDRLTEEMEDLETELREKVEDIVTRWEEALEDEEIFQLKPRRTDVQVTLVTPVWIPCYFIETKNGGSARIPAWQPEGEKKKRQEE